MASYNPCNAHVVSGPEELGQFIAQIVEAWNSGRGMIHVWHVEPGHPDASCDCPKLVFVSGALALYGIHSEQGGPEE